MNRTDKDQIIYMAMIGTFLTTYAAARGAVQLADTITDTVDEAVDRVRNTASPKTIAAVAESVKEALGL